MTDFAEIHDELRSVAADLLAKAAVDWSLLVKAGWVGLDVPEALGGAGATFAEVAVICEELGRAAATTGYLGGAVLGIGALLAVGPSASRDRLLTEVVEGHTRVALAVPGDMSPGEPEPPFGVAADGRVYGRAAFVPDAADAHRLLLPARDAAGATVLVEAGSGVAVSEQSVLDETRRLAIVVRVTVARQLVTGAVNDPSDETVAKAKSCATEAAVDIAGKAMQLHGGIGYTWESGIHTYLKRAALNRSLFGSPREYRSVLAARYRSVWV